MSDMPISPDPSVDHVDAVVRLSRQAGRDPVPALESTEQGLGKRYVSYLSETGGDHTLAMRRLEKSQREAAQRHQDEHRRRSLPDYVPTPLDEALAPLRTPAELADARIRAIVVAGDLDPTAPEFKRLTAWLTDKGIPKDRWPAYLSKMAAGKIEQQNWQRATNDLMRHAPMIEPDDPEYLSLVAKSRAERLTLPQWISRLAQFALKKMRQDSIPMSVVAQEGRGRLAAQGPKAAEIRYRQDLVAARGNWEKVWAAKEAARKAGLDVF